MFALEMFNVQPKKNMVNVQHTYFEVFDGKHFERIAADIFFYFQSGEHFAGFFSSPRQKQSSHLHNSKCRDKLNPNPKTNPKTKTKTLLLTSLNL